MYRASNFYLFFPFVPASRRLGGADDRHGNRKRRSDPTSSTSSPLLRPAFRLLSRDPRVTGFTRRRRPSHGISPTLCHWSGKPRWSLILAIALARLIQTFVSIDRLASTRVFIRGYTRQIFVMSCRMHVPNLARFPRGRNDPYDPLWVQFFESVGLLSSVLFEFIYITDVRIQLHVLTPTNVHFFYFVLCKSLVWLHKHYPS